MKSESQIKSEKASKAKAKNLREDIDAVLKGKSIDSLFDDCIAAICVNENLERDVVLFYMLLFAANRFVNVNKRELAEKLLK